MSIGILDRDTVLKVTRVPRSTLYRLVANDRFPKPVETPGKSWVWRSDDVAAWVQETLGEKIHFD